MLQVDVFLAFVSLFVHILGIDFRDFDKNEETQALVFVRKYRNMLLVGRRFLAASRRVYVCLFLYILEVIS